MTWPRTIDRLILKLEQKIKACPVSKLPIIHVVSLLQTVSEGDTERSVRLHKYRLFHMKGNIKSVEYFSTRIGNYRAKMSPLQYVNMMSENEAYICR